jgi:membrane-bound lytic murein transglycosylase MltF
MIAFLLLLGTLARADVVDVDTKSGEAGPTNIVDMNLSNHLFKSQLGDLDRIVKVRYLRVLTTRNPYDFFVRNGDFKGVQYEMVKEFVKRLNKKYGKKGQPQIAFEMIPVDFDQLIPMLNDGKGDIIAVGLTKTEERQSEIAFTRPYLTVSDSIVTRAELASEPWLGKKFVVQKDSSYLEALSKVGTPVKEVDPNLNAENLMELVSLKGADYTLVNSYWAESISKRLKNIVILKDKPFRDNVQISWAVRKESKNLLKELNAFIPMVRKGSLLGNTFGQEYFDDLCRLQSADFDLANQKISKFDDSLKKYASEFGFDWRLLAAQALEESRFDPEASNAFGAIGLFQIKQATANEPYVAIKAIKGAENVDNNIHAGVKYLAWLKKSFFDAKDISDEDKLRFTLAAYNAGPGRVKEAIATARLMHLKPDVWFRNVELAMLLLHTPDPVVYVSEINKHYVSYLLLGIR